MEDPVTLSFELTPKLDELNGGVLLVEFLNQTTIRGKKDPLSFIEKNQTKISPVSYYSAEGQEITLKSVAVPAKTGVKAVMASTTIISARSAFALFRVFQMIELLLFVNVKHPSNLSLFLDLFSETIFDDIPNPFKFITSETCFIKKGKLADQELSCYIFKNLGSFMTMVISYTLLYLLALIISKLVPKKNLVGRLGSWAKEKMDLPFWVGLFQAIQLDVFVNFFIVLTRVSHHDDVITSVNFAFTILVSMYWLGFSGFMIYKTHSVYSNMQLVKEFEEEQEKKKENMKKNRLKEVFRRMKKNQRGSQNRENHRVQNEEESKEKIRVEEARYYLKGNQDIIVETKPDSVYQRHYHAMVFLKDFLIAFSVVILHDQPILQTSLLSFSFGSFLILDCLYLPFVNKKSNFMEISRGAIYGLCCFMFLILSRVQDTMSKKSQFHYIGYPLIALVSVLILVNVAGSCYDTYLSIRRRFCRLKKDSNKIIGESGDGVLDSDLKEGGLGGEQGSQNRQKTAWADPRLGRGGTLSK